MTLIRPAIAEDVLGLPGIEVAAGEMFRLIGMDDVADDPPPDTTVLAEHVSAGQVWVAEAHGAVVGYAVAALRDGCAHLEQVTVHPAAAGRRLGAALIDAVTCWARERGDRRLTLTTFSEVPWNAPYYRRLGFRPLPDSSLGPQLAAELAEERSRFDAPRLAMARSVR